MEIDERLMKEYELAWVIINRLGNATIIIKGWSITLVVAIFGFSIRWNTIDEKMLMIPLSILLLLFWFTEATYRRVMETLKARCEEIEGCFEDMENKRNIISPFLAKSIAASESKIISLIKAAFLIRVYPIYLFPFFVGILVFISPLLKALLILSMIGSVILPIWIYFVYVHLKSERRKAKGM